ncbi:MAG: glycosyltransferase family 39 protein [Bacillota bacterium]
MKTLKIALIISYFAILLTTLIMFLTELIDAKSPLHETHTNVMYIWFAAFVVLLFVGLYFSVLNKIDLSKNNAFHFLVISIAIIFFVKIIISTYAKGLSIDVNLFTFWAKDAGKDLIGFYKPAPFFCDYPPLYITILAIFNKLTLIGIPEIITIRLPALFAEIGVSLLIFKIASKQSKYVLGLFLALAFSLNPLVIFDASLWGQMDSVLAFFIVLAIYLTTITHKRFPSLYFILSAVVFASALLIKPQALFFFPILIFALLKNKKFLPILYAGFAGVVTITLIVLPFQKNNMPVVSGILDWPVVRDFVWIVNLFIGTAGGYTYATVNAATTYFPLGKNWVFDSPQPKDPNAIYEKVFGLDLATFGLILVGLVILIAAFVFLKGKHPGIPWLTAAFLNAGIFMTATRMHERYMFTVVVLLIVAFIYTKDLIVPFLIALFTLTIYINTDYVYTRQLVTATLYGPDKANTWIQNTSISINFVSILNMVGLITLFTILLGVAVNNYIPQQISNIQKPLTRTQIRSKQRKLK